MFILAGTPVTVATLIVFGVIVVLTFLVSHLIQKALTRALKLRKVKDEGTVEVARRLLHYLVLATGLAIGLETIGVNLSALFAAGAVFAIGLGFAMQNIMQNFVSGVILLTERSIKPGDVLQVEGRFVRVQRMGIRATIARTLDEEEIIVPNSSIVQATVTNYTLQDSLYRLRCTVGVVYGSDMRLVRKTLEQVATAVPWRVEQKEPVVLLIDFGSSSVDWEVSVWMDNPWRVRRAKSELNEAIWWALKQAGITIAFPQLDVHFDPPVTEALRRVS
ncbi:MAG: mechanosensitive ion channel [Acidobacteriota bacterium]|nr:MAG: mechanosensitive ion channel [Acidobacteriota bacterium]